MSNVKDKDSTLHVYSIEYTRRWEKKRMQGSSYSPLRIKRGKPIAECKTVLARDEERARDIIKEFAKLQRFPGKSPLELRRTCNVVVSVTHIKEIY